MACSQFRVRDLKDSKIFLYTPNDPVIESSENLIIGPYNLAYPGLEDHAAQVGFDIMVNKWNMIFDFTKA